MAHNGANLVKNNIKDAQLDTTASASTREREREHALSGASSSETLGLRARLFHPIEPGACVSMFVSSCLSVYLPGTHLSWLSNQGVTLTPNKMNGASLLSGIILPPSWHAGPLWRDRPLLVSARSRASA